jgi:hypothetical protein
MRPRRSGCGRAGAWDAVHDRAAESAQADFAHFQRRIHSLPRADAHVRRLARSPFESIVLYGGEDVAGDEAAHHQPARALVVVAAEHGDHEVQLTPYRRSGWMRTVRSALRMIISPVRGSVDTFTGAPRTSTCAPPTLPE